MIFVERAALVPRAAGPDHQHQLEEFDPPVGQVNLIVRTPPLLLDIGAQAPHVWVAHIAAQLAVMDGGFDAVRPFPHGADQCCAHLSVHTTAVGICNKLWESVTNSSGK